MMCWNLFLKVEMMKKVLAIFCSDIHLSHRPPTLRSEEFGWYDAMRRPLDQIADLQCEHDNCPVVIAGDLFDRWDEPAEVINFALDALPDNVYAIPGQHDLPHHGYERIKRSAYWTLVESGKIRTLRPYDPEFVNDDRLALFGFPWGFDVQAPTEKVPTTMISVAVVHAFVWVKKLISSGYDGAPTDALFENWKEKVKAFDVGIFGDNHYQFSRPPLIYNCGTLIRRTKKEIDYVPRVGLLFEDGTMGSYELDCSDDVFIDDVVGNNVDSGIQRSELVELVERLESLGGDTSLDYADSVRRALDANQEMRQSVKELVIRSLESK